MPDDYEDPISLVAPASGRLCSRERDRDGRFVVSDLSQLAGESNRAKDWRRETLPTSSAVLSGIDFGRLYAWVCLESHRIGAGDTDLYRLALIFGLRQHHFLYSLARFPV